MPFPLLYTIVSSVYPISFPLKHNLNQLALHSPSPSLCLHSILFTGVSFVLLIAEVHVCAPNETEN